ncbi:AraC family transcriptional regulator [Mycolicibacterium neworleansense]|uniref:Transcriptional regulator n=1 Tax=Mycolicibacterium neworleansense TaxID=146018 RepID=A0A0H5RLJ9_9MYCO|nr:AraC family transcriptional regulator [Mycolicibacterium neworleansense]MCV7360490.1 AraC family transcriptional regulator ligand-binding domain-containing protein [Mycolicibacterium neworleansense]CRZ14661.1 transcriptional regulator [Mycolicibacterium neworleansense]
MTSGLAEFADQSQLPGSPVLHSTNRVIAAMTDPWDHPRSAVSVAIMCEWAAQRHISAEALLVGSHLDIASLGDVDTVVEASQELAVIRNLAALAGDRPGLGVQLGSRYHLTAYGYLGYLLTASASVRDTVHRGLYYAMLTFAFSTMTARIDDDRYILAFEADDMPEGIRRFVVERDLTAVMQIQRDTFPDLDAVPLREIRFAFADPRLAESAEVYRDYFRVPVSFGCARNEIVYDAGYLDLAPPMANAHTTQLMVAECDRIRAERLHHTGVAAQVRAHLLDQSSLDLTFEDVALHLHYAPRTLRRHLEREGTTYRAVLDEVRRSVADNLLRDRRIPHYEIANRLGYQDWSSVVRARRRWRRG